MPPSPTKAGTQKLSDLARHVVVPTGIVSTGWPAVEAKCLELGVRFDPWQQGLGRATLAKRADGKYAASVGGVVISIPRQVGKTYFVGALVFALCILFPGLTVIWTAHRLKTASETFRSMQGFARRSKVAPFIEAVFTGSGDEEVRFRNGSRILFGARERGFGRGFAEVDIIVFDEGQILGERALDDMVPAANQSKQPAGALLFFIGTPPKPDDPGEAFTAKRAKALEGSSTSAVFVEFSADPGADPNDRKQWAKANPSYPRRTPVEAMLRMQENLSAESFLREALGIWDDDGAGAVIPASLWAACADKHSKRVGQVVFAAEMTKDRSACAIAVAGEREDGLIHGEVVTHTAGTTWLVPELIRLTQEHNASVVVDPSGPMAAMIPALESANVPMIRPDVRAACGAFYDAVIDRTFRHMDQAALNAALAGAVRRDVGDGGWAWSRRKSDIDISPLYAVTFAVWARGTELAPINLDEAVW